METIDQIHQKLETMDLTPFEKRDLKPLVEQAFRAGFTLALEKAEQPDPLAGYSNLTAAIKAGEPIDWPRLDGLKVQCVKPGVGTLPGTLNRDNSCSPDDFYGWWDEDKMDLVYVRALCSAWGGRDGWSLWVEGEIPLVRKTADQLEVGTYFLGQAPGDSPNLGYVGGHGEASKIIHYAPAMFKAISPPSEWEVLEEYGTFQKPEGE